jgi:hypothetical protein
VLSELIASVNSGVIDEALFEKHQIPPDKDSSGNALQPRDNSGPENTKRAMVVIAAALVLKRQDAIARKAVVVAEKAEIERQRRLELMKENTEAVNLLFKARNKAEDTDIRELEHLPKKAFESLKCSLLKPFIACGENSEGIHAGGWPVKEGLLNMAFEVRSKEVVLMVPSAASPATVLPQPSPAPAPLVLEVTLQHAADRQPGPLELLADDRWAKMVQRVYCLPLEGTSTGSVAAPLDEQNLSLISKQALAIYPHLKSRMKSVISERVENAALHRHFIWDLVNVNLSRIAVMACIRGIVKSNFTFLNESTSLFTVNTDMFSSVAANPSLRALEGSYTAQYESAVNRLGKAVATPGAPPNPSIEEIPT